MCRSFSKKRNRLLSVFMPLFARLSSSVMAKEEKRNNFLISKRVFMQILLKSQAKISLRNLLSLLRMSAAGEDRKRNVLMSLAARAELQKKGSK
jgi:hypothetical protein